MEHLEETEIDLLGLGEQKKGWELNKAKASRRETVRETDGNLRRQTNLGGIAAKRRDNTISSPKGNKPKDHSLLW
eukprot:3357405-Ditylum_brightwellii.AAC.1